MGEQNKFEYRIEYGVLGHTHDTALKEFEGKVGDLLNKGFKLQGGPSVAGKCIYQALKRKIVGAAGFNHSTQ